MLLYSTTDSAGARSDMWLQPDEEIEVAHWNKGSFTTAVTFWSGLAWREQVYEYGFEYDPVRRIYS